VDFYPSPPWTGVEWLLVVVATSAKGLPLLVFVAVAVALARGRERRWLRSALAPEVGGSALSGIELDLLENPARRRRSRREMKLRAGAAAATLLRRLQHEQIRLAVARTRADGAEESSSSGAASEVAEQRELCTALRAALLAMPGAMPAGSLEPSHGGHR
jgi:hypothetical protein